MQGLQYNQRDEGWKKKLVMGEKRPSAGMAWAVGVPHREMVQLEVSWASQIVENV